jgi:hypothetical protein
VLFAKDDDYDGDPDRTCFDADGVALGRDCNDYDASISIFVTEQCDYYDNDCDGLVDEGVSIWLYPDQDLDGYGSESAGSSWRCYGTEGYAPNHGDCDDTDAARHPSQAEICDGLDRRGGAEEVE